MRRVLFGIGILFLAVNGFAQSADEIIARYIKTVGGMDRIAAVTSLKRTGKFTGGGGFEAAGARRERAAEPRAAGVLAAGDDRRQRVRRHDRLEDRSVRREEGSRGARARKS